MILINTNKIHKNIYKNVIVIILLTIAFNKLISKIHKVMFKVLYKVLFLINKSNNILNTNNKSNHNICQLCPMILNLLLYHKLPINKVLKPH